MATASDEGDLPSPIEQVLHDPAMHPTDRVRTIAGLLIELGEARRKHVDLLEQRLRQHRKHCLPGEYELIAASLGALRVEETRATQLRQALQTFVSMVIGPELG